MPGRVDGVEADLVEALQPAAVGKQVQGHARHQPAGAVREQGQAAAGSQLLVREVRELQGQAGAVVARGAPEVVEEDDVDLVAGADQLLGQLGQLGRVAAEPVHQHHRLAARAEAAVAIAQRVQRRALVRTEHALLLAGAQGLQQEDAVRRAQAALAAGAGAGAGAVHAEQRAHEQEPREQGTERERAGHLSLQPSGFRSATAPSRCPDAADRVREEPMDRSDSSVFSMDAGGHQAATARPGRAGPRDRTQAWILRRGRGPSASTAGRGGAASLAAWFSILWDATKLVGINQIQERTALFFQALRLGIEIGRAP